MEGFDVKLKEEDLSKSCCYRRRDDPNILIFVFHWKGELGNVKQAEGIFLNAKTRTMTLTTDYPFISQRMEKISTAHFHSKFKETFKGFFTSQFFQAYKNMIFN